MSKTRTFQDSIKFKNSKSSRSTNLTLISSGFGKVGEHALLFGEHYAAPVMCCYLANVVLVG